MRINPKATAVLASGMLMLGGGGIAYAADSCPGMGGTSTVTTTSTTAPTTTTTAATTTTTSATTEIARKQVKRHAVRHLGRR